MLHVIELLDSAFARQDLWGLNVNLPVLQDGMVQYAAKHVTV